jgi:hypothetical protein
MPKQEHVFVINGKGVDTLPEALDACREVWSEHKTPLIERQMANGGPKATDPAPDGADVARSRSRRRGASDGALPSLGAEGGK